MYTPQAGTLAAAIASIHERRTTTGGVNVVMGYRPPADVLLRQGVPGAAGSVLQLQKWHHEAAAWEAVPSVESLQRLRHA